ncbi:MAG: hypothetical protein LLF92_02700 [Planctomycetaceae bacterium]|nr:hypothetical protein [Planctomycetaceae bacterium]
MSDLSQQNNESTVISEDTDISSNWGASKKIRGKITVPTLQSVCSLPEVRKNKILRIRHRLMEGTYDIDTRLNVVFDRLLEDILV